VTAEVSKRIKNKQATAESNKIKHQKQEIIDTLEEFIDLDSPDVFSTLTLEEKLTFELSVLDPKFLEEDLIQQLATFIYKPRNLLHCYFKQILSNNCQSIFHVISISKHSLPSDVKLTIAFTEHDSEELQKNYSEFLAEFLDGSIKMA
jgi:hypothetical protein